ncbi:hypothetical protein OAB94_02145 [Flavobacteriaceae bacterium]|nr:hypothetical protein [Flavobacteriaceae bacterium]
MGIKGDAKNFLFDEFRTCFTRKHPRDTTVHLVSIDMMQYLKSTIPPNINSINAYVKYLVRQITSHLTAQNGCMVVVANFDLGSPIVKKLVTHVNRYDKRCALCKKTDSYSDTCVKDCINKQLLKYEDGPYLSGNSLPTKHNEWYRFAADSRNLRCELYPLIVNELLTVTCLRQGQQIVINGLQFKTIKLSINDETWETGYCATVSTDRTRIIPWHPDDLPVKFVEKEYHRVFSIEAMPPSQAYPSGWLKIRDRPEMKNDIHEADNSVFFFSQFFPRHNQMIVINDGDAIPIGLLRVAEDYRGSRNPTHQTILRLPNKSKSKKGILTPHKFDYVNLSKLYLDIMDYPKMKTAGVQNPVATFVFLIILAGTDFMKSFCPGIGNITEWKDDEKQYKRQRNGSWDTYFENMSELSHMVQWLVWDMNPNPSTKRHIVVDRVAFREFTYMCYRSKHLHDNPNASVEDIRVKCAKQKRVNYRLPSEDTIDVWCQNSSWNLQYWVNACRDIYIDPFEQENNTSFWGFDKNGITASVSSDERFVDEKYKLHFYENVKKSIKRHKKG